MKKIISLIVVLTLLLSLSACKNEKNLADEDFSSLVKLTDYKQMEIDINSYDYLMGLAYADYENLSEMDGFITVTGLDEGVVQILDNVIMDYTGVNDGEEFTSEKGAELLIGSSSYIDGFELGLLGKKIGETVELNLTFPDDYQAEELAGKDVVFTVKIKGVERNVLAEISDKTARNLGYDTAQDYYTSLESEYLSNYVWQKFVSNMEVLEYPEYEIENYIEKGMESAKETAKQSDLSLKEYLSECGYTLDEYREKLMPYSKPYVKQKLAAYSLADKENLQPTEKQIEEYIKENYDEDTKVSKNEKEDIYETLIVQNSIEFLLNNVKYIKNEKAE